ncbi:MAG: membrane protein insertion efficiency factor YidD [Candidatus Magasanikbacteria bacterium]
MLTLAKIIRIPRYALLGLIYVYQRLFSPDHSFWAKKVFPHGYCKFFPTCSQYSKEIIKKRGVFVGIAKSGWRVLRCNPWNKGGIDLPK